jgi:hypothetical protein
MTVCRSHDCLKFSCISVFIAVRRNCIHKDDIFFLHWGWIYWKAAVLPREMGFDLCQQCCAKKKSVRLRDWLHEVIVLMGFVTNFSVQIMEFAVDSSFCSWFGVVFNKLANCNTQLIRCLKNFFLQHSIQNTIRKWREIFFSKRGKQEIFLP